MRINDDCYIGNEGDVIRCVVRDGIMLLVFTIQDVYDDTKVFSQNRLTIPYPPNFDIIVQRLFATAP